MVVGEGLDCCPWMRWHSGHSEFLDPAGPASSTATPWSPDGHAHAESRKKNKTGIQCRSNFSNNGCDSFAKTLDSNFF